VIKNISKRLADHKAGNLSISEKPTAREDGFTLVELLITVVIIAILTAIAVPAYISVVTSSQDSAAKQAISSILAAEDLYYSGAGEGTIPLGTYATEATLIGSAKLIDMDVTKQNVVLSTDGKVVYVAVKADNGTVWWASTIKRDPVKTTPPAVGAGAAPVAALNPATWN
jgi:prepilin-type N-terminal cleavage/methylation domain-containing protein